MPGRRSGPGSSARGSRSVNAGRLARPLFAVPTGTPLAEAQRRYTETTAELTAGGRGRRRSSPWSAPPGSSSAWSTRRRRRGTARAAALGDGRHRVPQLDPGRVLPAELTGMALVEAVQANPGSEYVVTVGEDVLGVLRVSDVMQALESRGQSR